MLLAKLVTNKKVNTNRGSSMKSFNEIIYDVTKFGRKIKTSDYMGNGKYPIIDQGKNLISGYTNEENGIFVDVPAIIFGDHTRILKYIDTPFFLGADGTKILKAKNENCNLKFIYYALKNIKIPDTGYNRHYKWLKESSIIYPAIEHQDKIVNILDRITSIITLKKQQLVFLEKLKHSLFVEMFGDPVISSNGKKQVPFSEFIASIRYGTSQPPVFSTNGEFKFIRATNIKKGKIIPKDMLRIDAIEANKIKKCQLTGNEIIIVRSGVNAGDTGIITSQYIGDYAGYDIIVSIDLKKGNPVYFNELINTHYMEQIIKPLTIRSAQPHLNAQQVKELPMVLATLEEQNNFAEVIEQIVKHKSVVQKSLDETQLLFDSLMQKYFG